MATMGTNGMGEVGRSGLLISGGHVYEEFLPQLRDAQGRRIYEEMADNHPVIGGFLMAFRQTIGRLKWHIQEPENATDDEIKAAEFVQECVDDMSDSWDSTLSGIMSMCPYGWSYHEIVYKRRNGPSDRPGQNSRYTDGRIGWRKWAPRSQRSLQQWLLDDAGGIQGMRQQTVTGVYDIPIEKSLLFRTESAKNNPEGRSMLRNAYRPWYFGKRIEEIEAIGIERDLAGLPVVEMDPRYFSKNASVDEINVRDVMTRLVQSVKRNETEGVIIPVTYDDHGNKTIDFKLLSSGGTRNFDTDAIIARYNQEIAMSVLADFLMLGHENVGSQSLGVSKIELWMMAVEAIAKSIAAVVNQHAIPRLLKLNGINVENPPELVFGKVENVDLGFFGTFLKNATDAGLLIPDEGLEEHIREMVDLPPINKEEREDIYGVDGFIYGPKPVNQDLKAAQDEAALAAAQAAAANGGQPPAPKPAVPPVGGAGTLPAAPKGQGLPDVPGVTPKPVAGKRSPVAGK